MVFDFISRFKFNNSIKKGEFNLSKKTSTSFSSCSKHFIFSIYVVVTLANSRKSFFKQMTFAVKT
jgi:hypothetical protein